ncbi:hypothetical protein Aduo_016050 [Ancylostoma duodenale]
MARICLSYSQSANYVAMQCKVMTRAGGFDSNFKWFVLGFLACLVLMLKASLIRAIMRKLYRAPHLEELMQEEFRLGTVIPPLTGP